MWITQFFQRFISLIELKFEIIELFFRGMSHLIRTLTIKTNFNLTIRANSTEELGKLEKYMR